MAAALDRRAFLKALTSAAVGLALSPHLGLAQQRAPIRRPIPSTGEELPVIGMGTWITFDVSRDASARGALLPVLQAFFDRGGALIDSSPMYGSAEEVLGELLPQTGRSQALFAATKVWTPGRRLGVNQMRYSRELWGVQRFDLMQIHNMLDWETHLETLKAWKAEGRIRYVGITTSHGRRHDALEKAMAKEPFDFVQFTYNVIDREVEQRLLPLARDWGMAVIINRPFQRGALFEQVRNRPLPEWAAEFDCRNWAQFLLKFIVSHPAVTCAIPATSKVEHMIENMGANFGRLPDASMRKRMADYFAEL
ncbi:MAG TPA: aldo/keto reductase [Burkholderiales bacterium]|nr:aldo/keto reductase [Burkholderiales bacterium]